MDVVVVTLVLIMVVILDVKMITEMGVETIVKMVEDMEVIMDEFVIPREIMNTFTIIHCSP